MNNLELDINSYSTDDLFGVFNLNKHCKLSDLDEMFRKKQALILKVEQQDNTDMNNSIKTFLNIAYKLVANEIDKSEREKVFEDYKNAERNNNLERDAELERLRKLKHDRIGYVSNINESNYALNPITPNTVKKQISISSDYRKRNYIDQLHPTHDNNKQFTTQIGYKETSSSSDFIIELPDPLTNVISMEIVSTDIPIINYNITEAKKNNKFKITTYYTDSNFGNRTENSEIITIPDGYWFSGTLQEYLENSYFTPTDLSSSDQSRLDDNKITTLTFDINTITAKSMIRFKTQIEAENSLYPLEQHGGYNTADLSFSIENANSNDEDCIHKETNFSKTCLGTLGYILTDIYDINLSPTTTSKNYNITNKKFDDGTKFTYGPVGYTGVAVASEIFGNSSDKGFYIAVDDFVGNHGEQLLLLGSSNLINKGIMTRTQLTNDPFQMNTTENTSTDYSIKRNYYGEVKLTKLHIQILNNYGEIVNLQNFPTNFVFEFTQRYSSERQHIFNKKFVTN